MSARGVVLDRHSIPPQGSPILIGQSVYSGPELFNSLLAEDSFASGAESLVDVHLHVPFHIFCD